MLTADSIIVASGDLARSPLVLTCKRLRCTTSPNVIHVTH